MNPIASPFLFVTAAILLASAYFFARVAGVVVKRPYSTHTRSAGLAFFLVWAALAVKALLDVGRVLIPFLGLDEASLWVSLTITIVFVNAVLFWGLGYYVIFLWTGTPRYRIPLALIAGAHGMLFLYLVVHAQQFAVNAGTWSVRIQETGTPVLAPALTILVLVSFFLPVIVLATSYLLLSLRLEVRLQRLRAGSIALALITYQSVGIYLSNPAADPSSPLNPVLILVAMLAAGSAYLVYTNPRWLQTRFTGTPGDIEGTSKAPRV